MNPEPGPIDVSDDERDPVDRLAEEYADLCRRGGAPPITEFASRHPEFAAELRQVLPAVAFLERGKTDPALSAITTFHGSGTPREAPPLPERLGENRIVRELGRGGMGVVYEAIQEPLGRRVAVKALLRHGPGDSGARQRFLREAQAVARLRHPNIVPVFTVGDDAGTPYLVMERIEGEGLDRLMADEASGLPEPGPERARWAAGVALQAAEALAHAHGQGVLHRDVKPANLLVDADGQVWLADFGLAKLADDLSLTSTGELPGTLRYLAPECLRSESDERSDIYALGVTLYELALGRPAFDSTDRIRLLHQVEQHRFTAPRDLDPRVPRDLETIILKTMAREPEQRYDSAASLAEDLRRFLDGRAIAAQRTSTLDRCLAWSERNPVAAALAAVCAVLALLAGYLGYRQWIAPPPFPPPPLERGNLDRPYLPPGASDRPLPRDPGPNF